MWPWESPFSYDEWSPERKRIHRVIARGARAVDQSVKDGVSSITYQFTPTANRYLMAVLDQKVSS